MVVGIHRNAKIKISKQALYKNIRNERIRLPKDSHLFMVVKADGYGHGAINVAKIAKQAGADGFCVAILDEALELRRAGIQDPILVLGISRIEDVLLMSQYHISATVSSLAWLKAALPKLKQAHTSVLNIHLGLDTGMGRIGFQTREDLRDAIQFITKNPAFNFEGIFTHFSTADDNSVDYFNLQLKRFDDLMTVVKPRPKYVHVSNSATSLWHSHCNGNMIRFGVAAYGLNPSGGTLKLPYPLLPVLSLTTEIVYCKQVAAGRSIGYGATYTAQDNEWIATLPVGYADGITRRMQGFKVLVNGTFCPIIGRVCMDQVMIKVPNFVSAGTPVTIIGKDGENEITLQDIATYCGTIHYEVACLLTSRLPRVLVD